ncbi:hypothetical protein [Longimicrobium sp.]|nr:hypothetical protein [Longimicrobium sp.]HSU15023.1 hypothetical protein [Longimicrobium sp.]
MAESILFDTDVLAATALSKGVPLVSRNQRDFRFIADLQLLPYPPSLR